MASILTRKSRIAQPQDFVLVDDSLGDFHAAYVINNTLFNAKTGAFPAKNSNFTGGIGLAGSYLEPNANDKTLNPGIPAGDVYGVLYLFEVRQADITSASNAASIISVTENVNDASGVRIGSSTGYLTGETLAVVNSVSTRRTGISETIPKGLHTLVVQWNGSKYEIWLDGHLPAQLVAAGGDTQLLNFAPYIGLRSLSSQPRIGTYLFATSNNKNIDFREYQENPWRLLKPLQARIWVPVSSGGGITGTGATTTAATTASGTGTLTHNGTGALTTGATTASGTGVISHTGTGALTTGAVTASGTGTKIHSGTGDVTTAAITVDGTGTVTAAGEITGSGAIAIAAATVAGTGTISHTGAGALSVSPIVLSGAGVLTHTGTGDLTTGVSTASGTGTVLGEITGTGAITIGAVQVSGYDVLASVSGGGIGHGGFAKRRPRLIRIEEAENPEEVIAEIEAAVAESVKKPGRKPKTIAVVEKPIVEPSIQPNQWIDYYEQQAQRTREQDQLNDLIAKAKLKIQQLQAEDTFRRIQEYEARMREEEELMLLLMAA